MQVGETLAQYGQRWRSAPAGRWPLTWAGGSTGSVGAVRTADGADKPVRPDISWTADGDPAAVPDCLGHDRRRQAAVEVAVGGHARGSPARRRDHRRRSTRCPASQACRHRPPFSPPQRYRSTHLPTSAATVPRVQNANVAHTAPAFLPPASTTGTLITDHSPTHGPRPRTCHGPVTVVGYRSQGSDGTLVRGRCVQRHAPGWKQARPSRAWFNRKSS